MASYQVLPANDMLGDSLRTGIVNAGNMYSKYVMDALQRKAKLKQDQDAESAKFSKIDALRKDPRFAGMEQTISYDGSPSISFKPKKDVDISSAMKNIATGLATPEETDIIAQRSGMTKPMVQVPGMTMADGSVGMIEQPADHFSQDDVRQGLFPSYSKEQAIAHEAGLPAVKQTQEVGESFKNDFRSAIQAAGEDEGKFSMLLKGLARKYAADPAAMKLIKEQLIISSKKDSQAENISFGGEGWK